MSFDPSWFTTVPGMFITGGVLLLVVALIILIVSGKKSKKEKKALEEASNAPVASNSIPTDVNLAAGGTPGAPTMTVPGMNPDPTLASGAVAVDPTMAGAGVAPAMPDSTQVAVQNVGVGGMGDVAVNPMTTVPGMPDPTQVVAQPVGMANATMATPVSVPDMGMVPPVASVGGVPDMSATPMVTTPVADTGAIYGGASPVAPAPTMVQPAQPQIYGGVDPMSAVASVAPVNTGVAPVAAPGTIPVAPVAPVAPVTGMPQQ